jgi:hypothetical protein
MASAEGTVQIGFDAAIGSGEEDRIVEALDAIGRGGASLAERSRNIEVAKETRSASVRNAAASLSLSWGWMEPTSC